MISSGPADSTRSTGATFVFSAERATGFLCSIDLSALTSCSSPASYSQGTFGVGAHVFRVATVHLSYTGTP